MIANDSQYWVESGWVQIFSLVVGWVGLRQSADGLGRVTQNGPVDDSGINTSVSPAQRDNARCMCERPFKLITNRNGEFFAAITQMVKSPEASRIHVAHILTNYFGSVLRNQQLRMCRYLVTYRSFCPFRVLAMLSGAILEYIEISITRYTPAAK